MEEDKKTWIRLKVHKVSQPIGSFYFGVMNHVDLITISYSDIRRIDSEQRNVESYLGIERPLRKNRVGELKDYVNTADASFPSPIILAIGESDTDFDSTTGEMLIRDKDSVAKILDGQHRIAGLEGFEGDKFEVLVTIFLEMDIEYQATVFATINLEQTKVNRSLAYDLYAYATTRSPQKTGHNIVRLLNSRAESPFYNKIKVLGVAGDRTETISQALFIDSLLEMISTNPNKDRDLLRRGRPLDKSSPGDEQTLIFRNLFVDGHDGVIARVLWNYFKDVETKWGEYWTDVKPGMVLNRTTGFRGLMQFLPYACMAIGGLAKDPADTQFDDVFARVDIEGHTINPENYPPGTTGAARFRDHLKAKVSID